LEEAIKSIFKDSYTDINEEIADKLPIGNDEKDRAKRHLIWHAFDVNQNGNLSYSEVESGVKEIAKLP
jgi:hypothetical protein